MSAPSNADIEEATMATCEVCGNDYDKSFEVDGRVYCCAHCARRASAGQAEVADRA